MSSLAVIDEEVVKAAPAASKPTNSDLVVDWDDEGATASTDGLEKIAPADKNSVVRFAVLTDITPPLNAWVHFFQRNNKKASVRCLSVRDKKKKIQGEPAICCQHADEQEVAKHQFVVLGLEYLNTDSKTGSLPKAPGSNELLPIEFKIGWVKLTEKGFKSIYDLTLSKEEEEESKPRLGAHEMDIVMSHRDDGFGFAYHRVTRTARYRTSPALLAQVQAEAAQYSDGVMLARWLGKILTPVDMRILLGQGPDRKSAANINNTDDL